VPKITKLCFGFEIFWRKNIGAKCTHKMLMKMTTGCWWLDCLFALLGSSQLKTAHKRVGEINSWWRGRRFEGCGVIGSTFWWGLFHGEHMTEKKVVRVCSEKKRSKLTCKLVNLRVQMNWSQVKFLKYNQAANFKRHRDWGKVPPSWTRVSEIKLGKVRLSKVWLSGKYKECHVAYFFSRTVNLSLRLELS